MANFGEVETGWTRKAWIRELNRNAKCWERGAKRWNDAHGDWLRMRASYATIRVT